MKFHSIMPFLYILLVRTFLIASIVLVVSDTKMVDFVKKKRKKKEYNWVTSNINFFIDYSF